MNYAILTAGGRGQRMGSSLCKQYLSVAGIPILTRTLQVFDRCSRIHKIILVVPRDDAGQCEKIVLSPFDFSKEIIIVKGGVERQDSVFKGLLEIDGLKDDTDCEKIVVIHDGVRPFVTPDQIVCSMDVAQKDGASILALPAFDTVKRCGENNFIEKTLSRKRIWLAQTPQSFQFDLILNAHRHAIANGYIGTDDASLVEFYGKKVRMIEGSRRNIKITTTEDLDFAEVLTRSDPPQINTLNGSNLKE